MCLRQPPPNPIAAGPAEIGRAERERVSCMLIKELFAEIDRTRQAHPLPRGASDAVDLIREDRGGDGCLCR